MMKSQAGGLAMNADGYLDANNIQSLELGNLTGTVWGAVQNSYKTMSAMIADLQVRRLPVPLRPSLLFSCTPMPMLLLFPLPCAATPYLLCLLLLRCATSASAVICPVPTPRLLIFRFCLLAPWDRDGCRLR